LILQHLDSLRKDVEQLQDQRSNVVTRTELALCLSRLDQVQKEFQMSQETNLQSVCRAMEDLVRERNDCKTPVPTATARAIRADSYRVQPGDTLLKILARLNEARETNRLSRLTPEQIQSANPGLSPDKIRVGQTLRIPTGEAAAEPRAE
jgi:LysM repeat protein